MSTNETINSATINVDFSAPKYIRLNVKQGDNGIRHFLFSFTDNGEPVNFDWSTIYAMAQIRKPDGTYVTAECPISGSGVADLTITESITTRPGVCTSEIVLFQKRDIAGTVKVDEEKADNSIASMDFAINVFPSAIDGSEIVSNDDFSALNDLVSKMLRDYRYILNESVGVISAVRTINGHSPDDNGEYTLQKEDFTIVIDLMNDALAKKVPIDRTVNGKALSANITLNAGDVGADTSGTAAGAVSGHNASNASHKDIRDKLDALNAASVKSINGTTPDASGDLSIDADFINALDKSGGAMSGNIDMDGNTIKNVKTPVAFNEVVNKDYVDKKHDSFTQVLQPGAWSGEAPYTLELQASTIKATDMPHITPMLLSTTALDVKMAIAEAWACVSAAETSDGKITFTCFDTRPSYVIPIQIEVMR